MRIFSKLIGDHQDFDKYFKFLLNRLTLDQDEIRLASVICLGQIALNHKDKEYLIVPIL
jgi:hypothetical protein